MTLQRCQPDFRFRLAVTLAVLSSCIHPATATDGASSSPAG